MGWLRPIGWLLGPTLASMVMALIVVRIFDYLVVGAASGLVNTARAGLFVGTWTAVTTGSGMRDVAKWARRLRQGNASARSRLDALTKRERR